jgi:hypothetical protein
MLVSAQLTGILPKTIADEASFAGAWLKANAPNAAIKMAAICNPGLKNLFFMVVNIKLWFTLLQVFNLPLLLISSSLYC